MDGVILVSAAPSRPTAGTVPRSETWVCRHHVFYSTLLRVKTHRLLSPCCVPPRSDRAAPFSASAQEPGGGRAGWWPLVVIASAHLMAVLDSTVMFVALPSLQHGLGMSVTSRQWVITAYTLTLAGSLLLGGRLADRFGARRTLLLGVAGFACASAVGGAAVDATMIIAARAVQGAFGAMLISSTKSLLVTVYSDEDQRTRVMGIFSATMASGGALGLVLGGVLTSALSWRWCLYLNLALSLVVLIGGPRVLPTLRGNNGVRIDVRSVVCAAAGMSTLVYALGEAASAGWGSTQIICSLAVAAVALTVLVVRQIGHTDRLLPLRVVLDRNRATCLLF